MRESCFEQKFIGEEQEFEIVEVSHWLQAKVSALLLGQRETFPLFLKSSGIKFLHGKCPPSSR